MIKFYILALFVGFSSLVSAQAPKAAESPLNFGEQVKLIKFYPNPATSVINFEFTRPVQSDYVIQVYTFGGKKVYEQTNVSQKVVVQLQNFFRGLYIFQLKDKAGHIVESGKFQVNR